MSPESPDYEQLEPIPHRYAYGGIVVTVIIFQLINRVVVKVGLPEKLDPRDAWKWRNLFISWIHAVIIGTWDILCFAIYPEMIDDVIAYHNYFLYAMVVFSTGYFVYDFLDMLVNNKLIKMWEVTAHHFAVIGVFTYNIFSSRYLPYSAIALLVEVNSIFLHARKLLQMNKVSFSSLLYRVNVWVNLATFFVLRFGPLILIVLGIYYYSHRMSKIYAYSLSGCIFVMWCIHIVLFYRLLKNDVVRPLFESVKSSGSSNGSKHLSHNSNNSNNNENEIYRSKIE